MAVVKYGVVDNSGAAFMAEVGQSLVRITIGDVTNEISKDEWEQMLVDGVYILNK